jgi:CubicO group peptidase (beta-lactamase class C family)
MPGRPRALPRRPSLRYLKLEAKHRLAAGEFAALHDAQTAIAWEHGLPSWTALKQLICGQAQQESHALPQLRWVIARFRDAREPAWTAPDDRELRQHFDDRFLTEVPGAQLVAAITSVAEDLREEPTVIGRAPLEARVQLAGLEVFASVEADRPHRLTGLQAFPTGGRVTDARVAAPPPARTLGDVPAEMAEIADGTFAELGLAGLLLAGGAPDTPAWVVARGWADLDQVEILQPGHRFPAVGVAPLVTATAVLRLIADGRVALDSRANHYLRVVRLADDTITVRELLSHTAGVSNPAELFADNVPDLVALTGPVIACGGSRGIVRPSNGGYAALGQLIADATGSPYPDAVTRLVLEPLGMNDSAFPARTADIGPKAVTGYNLTTEGIYVPVPGRLCTIPAVGGLWATAADIVRLGTGWSSLLPKTLVREALTPQVAPEAGRHGVGFGWLISPRGDVALHGGAGPGATASLLIRIRDSHVQVTMTNRMLPIDLIHGRAAGSLTKPTHESAREKGEAWS